MAKILIRNFDRRILFFTYDDSVPDLDPVIFEHYGHAPNDHSLISTHGGRRETCAWART